MPNKSPRDFPPKLLWGLLALPALMLLVALFFPPTSEESIRRTEPCFRSLESNRLRFTNLRSVHYAQESLDHGYTLLRHKAFQNLTAPYFRPVLVYALQQSEAYIRFESDAPNTVLIYGTDSVRADTGNAEQHWRMAYALARRFRAKGEPPKIWSAERRELRSLSVAERKAFERSLNDYFDWIPPDACLPQKNVPRTIP
ncbi:hypothetical protein GC167_09535 [bacterium]|nr:hypothetical protein [bacterium]